MQEPKPQRLVAHPLFAAESGGALHGVRKCASPDPEGLVMRSGPDDGCRAIGVVSPASRDVIGHGCQKGPNDITTWCRITYGGLSGWVPDGFLARQN